MTQGSPQSLLRDSIESAHASVQHIELLRQELAAFNQRLTRELELINMRLNVILRAVESP